MVAKQVPKINKTKLCREIMVIALILIVVFLVRFIPWLVVQPIPGYDTYGKYKELLHVVEKFDYVNGDRNAMETRINASGPSLDTDPLQDYYNYRAKAEYYFNIGNYPVSIEALELAVKLAPLPSETQIIYELFVENYKAANMPEKAKYYEELLYEETS